MKKLNTSKLQWLAILLPIFAFVQIGTFAFTGGTAQASDPKKHYEKVMEIVQQNFLWEDRLDQSWNNRKTAPANVRTLAEAEAEIRKSLSTLNDKYTYYSNATSTTANNNRQAAKNVVTHKMLPGSIGYIKITTFSSTNTANEVEAALKALNAAGAKGYILDLRGNGGGLVWQSFEIFSLFADSGLFKEGRGRWEGKAWKAEYTLTATNLVEKSQNVVTTKARRSNLVGSKPVAILVNGSSASASETLAGALRHHCQAELIGTLTFGKGITQNTWKLDHNTSVKVTFALSYQPDGSCIHGTGMKPDHEIKAGNKGDAQLDKALEVLSKKI